MWLLECAARLRQFPQLDHVAGAHRCPAPGHGLLPGHALLIDHLDQRSGRPLLVLRNGCVLLPHGDAAPHPQPAPVLLPRYSAGPQLPLRLQRLPACRLLRTLLTQRCLRGPDPSPRRDCLLPWARRPPPLDTDHQLFRDRPNRRERPGPFLGLLAHARAGFAPGTSKPPTALWLIGGPSSVSTQSAPEAIRSPSLLIRRHARGPDRHESRCLVPTARATLPQVKCLVAAQVGVGRIVTVSTPNRTLGPILGPGGDGLGGRVFDSEGPGDGSPDGLDHHPQVAVDSAAHDRRLDQEVAERRMQIASIAFWSERSPKP